MRFLAVLGLLVVAACQAPEPNLSSTEQLSVVISPQNVNFGSQQVGQTTVAQTIDVTPGGTPSTESYDEVTAVTASCPDFVISAGGLPAPVQRTVICDSCYTNCPPQPLFAPICHSDPDGYITYAFTAAFRPTVAGIVSCVVTIRINDAVNRMVTLYGQGTVPPIDIDVQPPQVAFGDVRRNTTSTAATVNVRNLGGSTLTVSSVSITTGFAITAGPTGSYTVPPAGSQAYSVVCQPTAAAAISGTLKITSNDPSTPTVNVPLSCNGIDSNLDITPSPSMIPTTRVGEPRTTTITLVNTGGAPMNLASVALTGTDMTLVAAPPPGTVLAASTGSATVQVRFGAAASGDAAGTVVVTYDGAQVRSVPISARALGTSMALTPDGAVDLGPVCIGKTLKQDFSIIANDQGPFQISAITSPVAPFTLSAPTLPATVQGAGATTITFSVSAAPTTEGTSSSIVEVTTDIPGDMPRPIALTVQGLAAGLTGTPAVLDFGTLAVETTTLGQSVQVTNCSAAPTTLSNARIEGADAAEFAIVLPPQSLTIPASGSAAWLVVMQPRAIGEKHARFLVDHPEGTVTIDLTGEGLGLTGVDEDPAASGPASYYACSAGGSPAAAWPLALAFAFLLFRRRR